MWTGATNICECANAGISGYDYVIPHHYKGDWPCVLLVIKFENSV